MLDRLHQSCMSLSLWPSQVSFFYEPFIIISSLFVSLYVLHLIFLLLSFSIANIMQGRLFLPRNKQTFSSLQILQMIFQLLCRYLIFHSLRNKLHYIFNIILYTLSKNQSPKEYKNNVFISFIELFFQCSVQFDIIKMHCVTSIKMRVMLLINLYLC